MRFVDDRGREWKVYDYSIHAGKSIRHRVGDGGQYRGFAPVDGGARRTHLMIRELGNECRWPVTRELLLEQFERSTLYNRDDPDHCQRIGIAPERVDPAPN